MKYIKFIIWFIEYGWYNIIMEYGFQILMWAERKDRRSRANN